MNSHVLFRLFSRVVTPPMPAVNENPALASASSGAMSGNSSGAIWLARGPRHSCAKICEQRLDLMIACSLHVQAGSQRFEDAIPRRRWGDFDMYASHGERRGRREFYHAQTIKRSFMLFHV